MTHAKTLASGLATVFVATGLLALQGCSNDGLDKRYPVSGKVTYNGKPLAKGSINFMPEANEGRGAVGEIKDGAYTLTTQTPGDGAFPGKYLVTVVDLNVDTSTVEAETKKLAEKAKVEVSAGMMDQALVAKATTNAKSSIPTKYSQADTSGLKSEVKAESNKLDFDLKD